MAKRRKRDGDGRPQEDRDPAPDPETNEVESEDEQLDLTAAPTNGGPLPDVTETESEPPKQVSVTGEDTDDAGDEEVPDAPVPDAELDRLSSRDRAEIESLYRRARTAAEDGRLVEAEKGYRELLFRDPGHLKARNNLGYVYDGLGEPARALEEYRAALEIEPENVQLLNNVGAVLGTLGRSPQPGPRVLPQGSVLGGP